MHPPECNLITKPQPSLVMVTLPYSAARIPSLGLDLGTSAMFLEGGASELHLGFQSIHITGLSECVCWANEWAEWIWEGGESREPNCSPLFSRSLLSIGVVPDPFGYPRIVRPFV